MKGLHSIIKGLVALVIVIAIVVLIVYGARAVINLIEYNTADIELKIDDTMVDDNLKSFCILECKQCCMMARGSDTARGEFCAKVMDNTKYLQGEDPVPCAQVIDCIC